MPTAGAVKRLAVVTLAAGLVGGLAACGGVASPALSSAGTTRETAGQQVPAVDLVRRMLAAITSKSSATFTVETSGGELASSTTGQVRQDSSGVSGAATTTVGDLQTRFLLVSGDLYFNPGHRTNGKTWIKINEGGTDPYSQKLSPLMDEIKHSIDPSAGLALFAKAEAFQVIGSERVGGVSTTHYRSSIPANALSLMVPDSLSPSADGMFSDGPITVHLWLQRGDQPVKILETIPTFDTSITVVTTYRGWGEPVDIKAPPASDVATAADLAASPTP